MFDLGTSTTLVTFLVGIVAGLPIGWVFIGATALGVILGGGTMTFIANSFFHSLDSSTVMAIAFFVFPALSSARPGWRTASSIFLTRWSGASRAA